MRIFNPLLNLIRPTVQTRVFGPKGKPFDKKKEETFTKGKSIRVRRFSQADLGSHNYDPTYQSPSIGHLKPTSVATKFRTTGKHRTRISLPNGNIMHKSITRTKNTTIIKFKETHTVKNQNKFEDRVVREGDIRIDFAKDGQFRELINIERKIPATDSIPEALESRIETKTGVAHKVTPTGEIKTYDGNHEVLTEGTLITIFPEGNFQTDYKYNNSSGLTNDSFATTFTGKNNPNPIIIGKGSFSSDNHHQALYRQMFLDKRTSLKLFV